MKNLGLMVHLQSHSKELHYIIPHGERSFTEHFNDIALFGCIKIGTDINHLMFNYKMISVE